MSFFFLQAFVLEMSHGGTSDEQTRPALYTARRKLLRHKSEMSTATGLKIDLLMSLKVVNWTVMNSAY
jgi:hypothetical protein